MSVDAEWNFNTQEMIQFSNCKHSYVTTFQQHRHRQYLWGDKIFQSLLFLDKEVLSLVSKLKLSLRKCYSRHHDLVNYFVYRIFLFQMTTLVTIPHPSLSWRHHNLVLINVCNIVILDHLVAPRLCRCLCYQTFICSVILLYLPRLWFM